jgi:hypothetical protein
MLISAFLDVADNGGERKKKNTSTPFPVLKITFAMNLTAL